MTLKSCRPLIHYAVWIAIAASSSLLFAYGAERFFHIMPCELCVYERYAYMAVVVSGIIGWIFPSLRFIVFAVIFGLLALSVYHLGVEWHLWKSFCSPPVIGKIESISELKAKMLANPMPPCDQVNWRIFGISATIINTGWVLCLLLIATVGEICRKKCRR